jgi:hypothetical protein
LSSAATGEKSAYQNSSKKKNSDFFSDFHDEYFVSKIIENGIELFNF